MFPNYLISMFYANLAPSTLYCNELASARVVLKDIGCKYSSISRALMVGGILEFTIL